MNVDYYEVLEVDSLATKEEIRKSYILKSKTAHPDVGGNAEDFSQINEAYKVLYDDEARRIYDATGKSIYNPIEIEEESKNLLVGIFTEIIEYDDFWYRKDVLADILEDLKRRQTARIRDTSIVKELINKCEQMVGKVKKEKKKEDEDEDNIFDKVILQKIQTKREELALAELDVKIIARSIEVLDEYNFTATDGSIMDFLKTSAEKAWDAMDSRCIENKISEKTTNYGVNTDSRGQRSSRGMPIIRGEDLKD